MSDREEFEKAMRKVYVGYYFVYLEHMACYTEDCIDDAWTGWKAATASMQAKADVLEAKLNVALGALADFAYSEDVTLEVVKAKSKRLHSELTEGL